MHRELIREWLWEPKGAPLNISRCFKLKAHTPRTLPPIFYSVLVQFT